MKTLALWCLFTLACPALLGSQGVKPATPASADFVRPGETETLPASLTAALAGLRQASLSAHVAALSAPAFEGRALGSHGLEATAEYAAASLAVASVAPAASAGSDRLLTAYFQVVPLREISHPSGQVTVEARRGDAIEARTFHAGLDVLLPEVAPEVRTAPVVFAGYGIREPSPARDDYRGLDVKDKIVVLLGGLPADPAWQAPALMARYGLTDSVRQRFAAKADLATSLGARAVIAIENDDYMSRRAAEATAPAATFFMPADDARTPATPVIQVSPRVGSALLASAGLTAESARDGTPRALAGTLATITFTGDERLVMSRNVIGVVPGSDPALNGEAVVVGAHMDHLGRIGDRYYPGADDNASGVAALLELARTVASAPHKPRRTIVFACWTGEEEGKLGSGYYVRHPRWPLERTAVYVNLDMIGHPWTPAEIRRLVADTHLERGEEFLAKVSPAAFIELGVADWAADLDPVLAHAARGTGLALHLDHTDGKNGGSDYRDFARRGVKFVRVFGNYFDGYHEPTDTADAVEPGHLLRVTRLALASVWLLADR